MTDPEVLFPLIMYGVWLLAFLGVCAGLAFGGDEPRSSNPGSAGTSSCKLCRTYPLPNCYYCRTGSRL